MRRILKWIIRIVVFIIVVATTVVIFKNQIARFVVEWELRNETGMKASIRRMEVGFLSPVIRIENLRLQNTAQFGGSTFVDIPEIHVEYDRDALASGKFHATLMRFNMAEVTIVKNQAGQTNIYVLADHMEKSRRKKKRQDTEFTAIDELQLTLGKARYLDLKTPANNFEFNFFLQNEVVKNVKSERDLSGVILLAVIRNTTAMASTRDDSFSSFLRNPQASMERTKQYLELLIPPKRKTPKPAVTNSTKPATTNRVRSSP